MSKIRTYIDANVLIAAWRGDGDAGSKALEILEDPQRVLIVSDPLWLEVLPKPMFYNKQDEVAFYEEIFRAAAHRVAWSLTVLDCAKELAVKYGIAAMDAIHVAAALASDALEFVSGEKPGKPMFRVTAMHIISLQS